ncbi:MAG: type II toxin-antitoxin system Phd/YefM family antitoxin [Spirochaetaceae bacterium]|nr:MAG: type II toxin-antitoxin system Phd/YefM family antitoxin [Spirochaetaceae bacterium]
MELHPKILEKNGRKEFVILPYEEFEQIEQELGAYHDLQELREAKEAEVDSPTEPLSDVRKTLGI